MRTGSSECLHDTLQSLKVRYPSPNAYSFGRSPGELSSRSCTPCNTSTACTMTAMLRTRSLCSSEPPGTRGCWIVPRMARISRQSPELLGTCSQYLCSLVRPLFARSRISVPPHRRVRPYCSGPRPVLWPVLWDPIPSYVTVCRTVRNRRGSPDRHRSDDPSPNPALATDTAHPPLLLLGAI
ncbi:hypothetical protein OH76DRAFT_243556 [Lentinus brumalis]|uniref:Uncharacterized protein n=1 Tax=Lentinus brumalis TaxID=2498619 RepID=A0A371DHS5_9APHY|nr:hypothetical protein OH76DRAFT_243556 [Polyporus brumalis]